MDRDQFWSIMERVRPVPPDAKTFEPLKAELLKLPPEEILQFRVHLDDLVGAAYKIDLWGAGAVIHGGCSDDGFHYFCNWLILQGRDVFQKAVTNPDSLANVLDAGEEVEWCGSPGQNAWFAATKRKPNEKGYDALQAAESARYGKPQMMPDLGGDWDFDDEDEMRKRFPRLYALYMEGDEEE
jgi:hypothetical protein